MWIYEKHAVMSQITDILGKGFVNDTLYFNCSLQSHEYTEQLFMEHRN